MNSISFYLELAIAMVIVLAIIIGMIDLLRYLSMIFTTNPIETYNLFQKFLGHALLLVVGVELVKMLVLHSPISIVEVLLYAISRKMLIGSENIYDYLFGIISITLIFAINKYFMNPSNKGKSDI